MRSLIAVKERMSENKMDMVRWTCSPMPMSTMLSRPRISRNSRGTKRRKDSVILRWWAKRRAFVSAEPRKPASEAIVLTSCSSSGGKNGFISRWRPLTRSAMTRSPDTIGTAMKNAIPSDSRMCVMNGVPVVLFVASTNPSGCSSASSARAEKWRSASKPFASARRNSGPSPMRSSTAERSIFNDC